MADVLSIAMTVAWAVAAAGLAVYAAAVAGEVTYVTLADGRRQARSLPALFKMLLPFVGNLDRLVGRPAFAARAAARGKTLVSAGFEGLLDGREFVALEVLCPAVAGTAWCALTALLGAAMPDSPFASARLPLCAAGALVFAALPSIWLRGELRRRHLSIMKALPFVLDLLTLSVVAGLDFMSALQRNCQSRRLDPLNEELLRMTHEIQIGTPRRVALRNMADRVGQSDLRSLAHALIQADEFGVPIGTVLRIQSDQLRGRRFSLAEKKAGEAPTKMLGPLMLCIFPAVFLILLGPVVLEAVKGIM